ncbi:MAG: outer membrane beta-barrel protein [Candidatus Krumholzibacteriota bacterium]|nr:outer membrane beta-barrel protein [Candidatus Krumholzibacteriota bacterium]
MKHLLRFTLILACLMLGLVSAAAQTEKPGAVGVRVGAGTDIEGGVAYGGQLDYIHYHKSNAFELGLAFFSGKFEEESSNGFNTYYEETKVLVVGAIFNYLIRYSLELEGPYFVSGIGVGAVSVEWEERSPTDTTLGTLLPGGGSMQDEDGTVGGMIINFGIGYRFNETFDLRAQVPTFFISGSDERDSAVVPTFTITLGLHI